MTPVTCGCDAGVVWPARIRTDEGEIVTYAVSELERETVTSLTAGASKVTAKAAVCAGASATPEGSPMTPPLAAAVFVSKKGAVAPTPATEAVTVYGPPTDALAVAVTLARPEALVVTARLLSVALAAPFDPAA